MTPENYNALVDEGGRPEEERIAAWNALSEEDRYRAKRLCVERGFRREHLTDDAPTTFFSPSGRFCLTVTYYQPSPRGWKYTRGVVTECATGNTVADVRRNFMHFPHCWVTKGGREYLLCGEDYQGYGIADLVTGEIRHHFPPIGHAGGGFCWSQVRPSSDAEVLAVEGCVWAASYDIVFYDFRDPMNPPYRQIGCMEDIADNLGWQSDGSYLVTRKYEVRASDAARYSELPEVEQARLDTDSTLTDYRTEQVTWQRPTLTTLPPASE